MAILLKRVLHWVEALGAAMAQDELGYWLTRQRRAPPGESARGHLLRGTRVAAVERGETESRASVFDVSALEGPAKSVAGPDRS